MWKGNMSTKALKQVCVSSSFSLAEVFNLTGELGVSSSQFFGKDCHSMLRSMLYGVRFSSFDMMILVLPIGSKSIVSHHENCIIRSKIRMV